MVFNQVTIYMISEQHGLQSMTVPCNESEQAQKLANKIAVQAGEVGLGGAFVSFVYTKFKT